MVKEILFEKFKISKIVGKMAKFLADSCQSIPTIIQNSSFKYSASESDALELKNDFKNFVGGLIKSFENLASPESQAASSFQKPSQNNLAEFESLQTLLKKFYIVSEEPIASPPVEPQEKSLTIRPDSMIRVQDSYKNRKSCISSRNANDESMHRLSQTSSKVVKFNMKLGKKPIDSTKALYEIKNRNPIKIDSKLIGISHEQDSIYNFDVPDYDFQITKNNIIIANGGRSSFINRSKQGHLPIGSPLKKLSHNFRPHDPTQNATPEICESPKSDQSPLSNAQPNINFMRKMRTMPNPRPITNPNDQRPIKSVTRTDEPFSRIYNRNIKAQDSLASKINSRKGSNASNTLNPKKIDQKFSHKITGDVGPGAYNLGGCPQGKTQRNAGNNHIQATSQAEHLRTMVIFFFVMKYFFRLIKRIWGGIGQTLICWVIALGVR